MEATALNREKRIDTEGGMPSALRYGGILSMQEGNRHHAPEEPRSLLISRRRAPLQSSRWHYPPWTRTAPGSLLHTLLPMTMHMTSVGGQEGKADGM